MSHSPAAKLGRKDELIKYPLSSVLFALYSFYDPLKDVTWRRIEGLQGAKVKIRARTQRKHEKMVDTWNNHSAGTLLTADTYYYSRKHTEPNPTLPHHTLSFGAHSHWRLVLWICWLRSKLWLSFLLSCARFVFNTPLGKLSLSLITRELTRKQTREKSHLMFAF